MSITSTTLLVLIAAIAVLLPIGLVLWRRKASRTWVTSVVTLVGIAVSQVAAVSAAALQINRQYGFYSSWSDAMGEQTNGNVAINVNQISADAAGDGSLRSVPIAGLGKDQKGSPVATAVAWLPPGYNAKANKKKRYPVVVFLPGYANTVGSTLQNFKFGAIASQLIKNKKVPPFIAVFAPYQTVQGRDTECTNIKGANEFSFLTKAVPNAVRSHLRVQEKTKSWSALGWSTGGYCATKALYANPAPWNSAVSIGGYFEALEDSTTGNLYPTKASRIQNSPIEQYRRYQMPDTRLLIVSSKQDTDAYGSSSRMAKLAEANPNVSSMWIPNGGHNYNTYTPYVPQMLKWAVAPAPGA